MQVFLAAYCMFGGCVFSQKAGTLYAVNSESSAYGIYRLFHGPHFLCVFVFKQAHLFKGIFLDLCSAQTW